MLELRPQSQQISQRKRSAIDAQIAPSADIGSSPCDRAVDLAAKRDEIDGAVSAVPRQPLPGLSASYCRRHRP